MLETSSHKAQKFIKNKLNSQEKSQAEQNEYKSWNCKFSLQFVALNGQICGGFGLEISEISIKLPGRGRNC